MQFRTLAPNVPAFRKSLLKWWIYHSALSPPQICFLMTVNVIGQRMNFLVIVHGCWLVAIMVRRRRAAIAKIWPKYCLFLVFFTIYQYILCVGIPPALCLGESSERTAQAQCNEIQWASPL